MPYHGRPSEGCQFCRKSKKSCDQVRPICGRCRQAGRECGGYRNPDDLLWHHVRSPARRRNQSNTPGARPTIPLRQRPIRPQIEEAAQKFFFQHFVASNYFSFFENISPGPFLRKPILACSFAVLANKETGTPQHLELARQFFGDAIAATSQAISDERQIRDDNTLMAIFLLGQYEWLSWEGPNMTTLLKNHRASSEVIERRGRGQLRNKFGLTLFRDLRAKMVMTAMWYNEELPSFLLQWSQVLAQDRRYHAGDRLFLLSARLATVRKAFRKRERHDEELLNLMDSLERDLVKWEVETHSSGAQNSFRVVQDIDPSHAWYGIRHEYGETQGCRQWIRWRCNRIFLSGMQEAIWQRQTSQTGQPSPLLHGPEYYQNVRREMAADICIAAAGMFGNDPNADPPPGSVASSNLIINAFAVVGVCLLQRLQDQSREQTSVDGEALSTDTSNAQAELDWVVERTNYLSTKVGIRWAGRVSNFLRNPHRVELDPNRSDGSFHGLLRAVFMGTLDLTPRERQEA